MLEFSFCSHSHHPFLIIVSGRIFHISGIALHHSFTPTRSFPIFTSPPYKTKKTKTKYCSRGTAVRHIKPEIFIQRRAKKQGTRIKVLADKRGPKTRIGSSYLHEILDLGYYEAQGAAKDRVGGKLFWAGFLGGAIDEGCSSISVDGRGMLGRARELE